MMLVLGVCIFAKAFYIQNAEGAYWRSLSDSLHLEYREMDAERGTIYSEDGRMLSSSIPFFDIYLDFGAQGIQEKMARGLNSILTVLLIIFRQSYPKISTRIQKGVDGCLQSTRQVSSADQKY